MARGRNIHQGWRQMDVSLPCRQWAGTHGGSVARNILAAISCAEESAAASISRVVGKFLQHYDKRSARNL